MKAIVIDDEYAARESLTELLNDFCKGVEIIGEADSVETGVKAIEKNKSDLVFLDINLSDGTGFEILERIKTRKFEVIFVTAYEEFAIKAFKFSALDYILKPVDPDELFNAVSKAEKNLESGNLSLRLNTFFDHYNNENHKFEKIVLKTAERVHLVELKNIIRCQSDRNYTHFFIDNKGKITVSKTLKDFDDLLADYNFFRIHQTHLINLDYFDCFEKGGARVIMKDESVLPVSSRKKDDLIKYLMTFEKGHKNRIRKRK